MNTITFCDQLIGLEPSLLKYAYHLRPDISDARDLVQETFLKAIQSRDKFVDSGFLKAWTFTILRNTFINNYRHNALQKTNCERLDESFSIKQTKSSVSDEPDSIYSFKEITRSIEQLKDNLRIPFKMYVEGYKYREIAETINLKVGTVKSRIFLARKALMCQLTN
jgi:RNA polymerase sigma factor (sigma-70 family)